MKKKDITVLIDGFRRLSADAAEIAELLSGTETTSKKTAEVQAEPETPAPAAEETPAKVYTFEGSGSVDDETAADITVSLKNITVEGIAVTNIFKEMRMASATNAGYYYNTDCQAKDIDYSPIYLERFFRNLLLGEHWDLRNRYLRQEVSPRTDP